jgi:acyltransferase
VTTGDDSRRVRSAGPDQLKALLLALVIFGHTFSEGVSEDAAKWMLYGFHMPAFLFLSGWLLSAERLHARSLWHLVEHYWKRMLAAWLAVSILYLAVHQPESFDSLPRLVRDIAFTPEFHLWYVPTLFVAILLARVLTGRPGGRVALLVLSVAGYLLWRTPLSSLLPDIVERNLDDRYLGFLVWFVLGLYARNGWLKLPGRVLAVVLVVVGAALYATGFEARGWFSPLGFLALNVGFVALVPLMVRLLDRPLPVVGPALISVGRNSLWIYLLHPFVTDRFRSLDLTVPVERAAGVGLVIAILLAAYLLARARALLNRAPQRS